MPVLSYADAVELAPHMASCKAVVPTTNRTVFDINRARVWMLKADQNPR